MIFGDPLDWIGVHARDLRPRTDASTLQGMTSYATPSGPGYCPASTCQRNVDNRDAHELVAHSGRQLTRPSRESAADQCVKCGVPTDDYCQICKRTMCAECITGHSHGMDK